MQPVIRSTLCLAVAAVSPAGLASPAAGAGQIERQVSARWVVTWAGLPVFEAHIDADIRRRRYAASFRARSRGIVELAARLRTQIQTRGQVAGNSLKPARVEQRYRLRKGGHRTVLMSWRADGRVSTRILPPESPGKRNAVPARMQRATEDPITATLNGLLARRTGPPCVYSARVFEGRRRLDIRLSYVGQVRTPALYVRNLPETAVVCLLYARRLAGFHDRHLRDVPKLEPARVWLVHHPAVQMWVPVQIEFRTRYGIARARLVALKATPS